MNKADLASRIATRTSMSKAGADALAGGETITIAGFGTFSTRSRLARRGRYPRTGESIAIAASNAPSFKVGKTLQDAVRLRAPRQRAATVPLHRCTTELCRVYRKVCDLRMESHEFFQHLPIALIRAPDKG